jgi:solute carrier family 45 protein 1/2/4
MNGVGNILGMLSGFIDLPNLFPLLGNTQFRVLCAVSSLSIVITAFVNCYAIAERDPTLEEDLKPEESILCMFKDIFRYVFRLPSQIAKVCIAQFMAWMGWFPFLFYSTTYIGGIYAEPYFRENPNMSDDEIDIIWERATRKGALALLIFAIIAFISSVVLPLIVTSPYKDSEAAKMSFTSITPSTLGSYSRSTSKADWFSTVTSCWIVLMDTCSSMVSSMEIRSLTLRRAWIYSHILYTVCMWLTFVVNNITLATILLGLVGVSWSVTQWAPYALISAEISKRHDVRRGLLQPGPGIEMLASGEDDLADKAGVVMGIHNVAISAPQVIATIISSIIFKFLQKPRGYPGDESVVWCLRFGGLCSILAACLTLRVDEVNLNLIPVVRNNRLVRSNSVSA